MNLTALFADTMNIAEVAKKDVSTSRFYAIDRINNSFNFDQLIVELARSKGYDTVQFVTQPNGNGGWAWEIVFVNQPLFLGTDAKRMEYVAPRLYIADPCDTNIHKHCAFNYLNLYPYLYYEQQKPAIESNSIPRRSTRYPSIQTSYIEFNSIP